MLVSEANASERLGAVVVLHEAQSRLSRLEVVWVDQGYAGENFERAVQQVCGESVRVEVIARQAPGFEILPKRWIKDEEREARKVNSHSSVLQPHFSNGLHTSMSEAMPLRLAHLVNDRSVGCLSFCL